MLAQLVDEVAVGLHLVGDELHVFANLLGFVCALAVFGDSDAVLGLCDFAEALLDLVER